MKKIIFLILLNLLPIGKAWLGSNVANAQSSFHIGYQRMTVQAKDQEGSRCNSNGGLIGYQYRLKVQKNIPLFITIGAEANLNWNRTSEYEEYEEDIEGIGDITIPVDVKGNTKYKTVFGGLKVPVNFAYEFMLSKSKQLCIIPQIGIHAYCNFDAKQTVEGLYDVYYRTTGKRFSTISVSDTYGLIGSHDLGVYSYHRIVAGWQIGCSIRYGHYILGGTLEQELMHLTDYGHSTTFTVKVGYEL